MTVVLGNRLKGSIVRSTASLPAWFYYLFFFIAPVGLIFWYSFGRKPDLFTPHSNDKLSLDRYGDVLQGTLLESFIRTLIIGVVAVGLCLLIAYPFAYWMATKVTPKWRYVILVLVMIPFWTNFLVRTIGWQLLLSNQGWLSDSLHALSLGRIDILGTTYAVELGVVYNYLPLMILPLFVTFDRMDHALREASKDLGAARLATFAQVTLPQSRPGIAAGLLLVYVPLMGDYVTGTVLGGAKGTMVGQHVANEFLQAQDWATGSAAAVVLVLLILASVGIVAGVAKLISLVVRWRYGVAVPEPAPASSGLVVAGERA